MVSVRHIQAAGSPSIVTHWRHAVVEPYNSHRLHQPAASDLKMDAGDSSMAQPQQFAPAACVYVPLNYPTRVGKVADSGLSALDWFFGESSADLDNWNNIRESHTTRIEQSPVAHDNLIGGLAVSPVEDIPQEHPQSTFDRSPASNSHQVESIKSPNPISRHACDQCGKGFKSQNDADRHRRSIHEKSTPYFCHEAGCRRSDRGFSRKDNYEKHLLNVHRKPSKSRNTGFALRREGKESAVTDHGLEGYSQQQLVYMLREEREKCRNQQRELQEVKDELMKLKCRIERREDMWLKALVAKETR